jgi:DNA modification methylase
LRGGPAGRFPRRGPGSFPPRGDRGLAGVSPRGDRAPGGGFAAVGSGGPRSFGKLPFRAPYGAGPKGAGKPRRFEKRSIPVAPMTAPTNRHSLESSNPDVDRNALLVPTLPKGFAVEALPVDVPIAEAVDGTAAPLEAATPAQTTAIDPKPVTDPQSAERVDTAPKASASNATESASPSEDDMETAAFDETASAAKPFVEPKKMRSKAPVVVERKRPRPTKSGARGKKPFQLWQRPPLELQTTTLWDYPSQHYGIGEQGSKHYKGATPSYVIWNLLQRYTAPNDTVVDPMCGSGTTLDVCRDTGRKGIGFDLAPFRKDIQPADARAIPLADGSVSFVFVDPPYSTHLKYSNDDKCIGRLDAANGAYYDAMETVFAQMARILKPGGHAAVYVCDSFKKGKPFQPIGFELFTRMRRYLEPVDIVAVTRHNKSLKLGNWHRAAAEGNFFLRGFNYLFIFRKPNGAAGAR